MSGPSAEYRRTALRTPEPLLRGLDAAVNTLVGAYQRRAGVLADLRAAAEEVDRQAPHFVGQTDHQLQQELLGFRERFRRGGRDAVALVPGALGAIREAADRQLGLRPFLVQVMGALALYRGCLAEMATGEGKTLTAGLAAVLWAWSHKPCHLITVNDYLVKRDAEWLGPLYRFCGVRVGVVTGDMDAQARRRAYHCDLTYTTSKEVVADFLRDGLRLAGLRDPTRRLIRRLLRPGPDAPEDLVMRGLHAAIVDEADSVLIDEAVTPLIISAPRKNEALREVVQLARRLTEPLRAQHDYAVNHRYREIELTAAGVQRLETLCAPLPGIWRSPGRRLELVKQALVAREFYQPGQQYLIVEGRIVIVDEFTGRQMPQRTWRQGMHQAIEAKEGLAISDPSETLERISFQRYFRLYERLAGMTGTASEAAAEFWQIYRLPVVTLPTNRPCLRQQAPDRLFARAADKWDAIEAEIQRIHATGRPILVGTRSVEASEQLGARLSAQGLAVRILNAIRPEEEASIIALAGEQGRITIATNMAGRGTDIRLGPGVARLGGLHVVATERHESLRVDRQLFGRSARQGDPGSAQALVSLEDELLRRSLPGWLHARLRRTLPAGSRLMQPAGRGAFRWAQRNAQHFAFQQRRNVLALDDWMEEALSFAGR